MRPAKKFHAAAQNNGDPVFDFAAEVAQVWRDFPDIKNKVIFLDACNEAELVYPEEGAEKEAVRALAKSYDVRYEMKRAFSDFKEKTSFCCPLGNGRRFIFLLAERHSHDKISPRAPLAQETTFIFDHEFAHALIPEGSYSGGRYNRAECIADAYATIRHLQRYGADSPFIDHIVNSRAFDLVFRDKFYGYAHFTSPVTEKILARRHDADWNALTPQETAQLARKCVLEYEMEEAALSLLAKEFEPMQERAESIKQGDTAPLRDLAKKVLSTDVSDVFKYGHAALAPYIDRKTAGTLLQGKYWDKVRRQLKRREKRCARYGVPRPVKTLMKKIWF